MYRIAICDDKVDYLEVINGKVKEYCERNGIAAVIKLYSECGTLVEDAECGRLFDAYILDIEMEGYSGMRAAKAMGKYSSMVCIIFLTAYAAYSIEACGMNIFRYVLKERLDREFEAVMGELFCRLERMKDSGMYLISNQRKYVKVSQRDIIYIYKRQKNIVFVLSAGREEWERSTLKEAYEKLRGRDMFFLDRGIILNLFHVQKITGDRIYMTEEHSIATTAEHISQLKRALHTYWGEMI